MGFLKEGEARGTPLYGFGVYLAERITKADSSISPEITFLGVLEYFWGFNSNSSPPEHCR